MLECKLLVNADVKTQISWGWDWLNSLGRIYLTYVTDRNAMLFYNGIVRGSYMSAHVLSNVLNGLNKRDELRGMPSIFFSLFRNNTGAQMTGSIFDSKLDIYFLSYSREVFQFLRDFFMY